MLGFARLIKLYLLLPMLGFLITGFDRFDSCPFLAVISSIAKSKTNILDGDSIDSMIFITGKASYNYGNNISRIKIITVSVIVFITVLL
jgi:hypothetical protein